MSVARLARVLDSVVSGRRNTSPVSVAFGTYRTS